MAQELFVESFRQHMNAKVAPIQFHSGKPGPWRRAAGSVKQLPANLLIQEGAILDGIIKRKLLQPVKGLARRIFLEIQSQSRVVIDRAIAPGPAFDMNLHVRVNLSSLPDCCQGLWTMLSGKKLSKICALGIGGTGAPREPCSAQAQNHPSHTGCYDAPHLVH